ncbi:hypothetical protein SK128_010040 [Halocaridina rubra]|uniref:Uncharacterized protein n=1 Tax=Halocaridina rubra TaxID=373956 RepID=A0AAN8X7Y9_HALRR
MTPYIFIHTKPIISHLPQMDAKGAPRFKVWKDSLTQVPCDKAAGHLFKPARVICALAA